jgi:hypothetical protein
MSPDTQTHTLPLALMAVLVLLGVAVLDLLYYRKRQLQGKGEGQFKGFREKAVALIRVPPRLLQKYALRTPVSGPGRGPIRIARTRSRCPTRWG